MAAEHVALLKRNYAALNRAYASGDFEAYQLLLATSGQWVEHGEWRGLDGALECMQGQLEALEAAGL